MHKLSHGSYADVDSFNVKAEFCTFMRGKNIILTNADHNKFIDCVNCKINDGDHNHFIGGKDNHVNGDHNHSNTPNNTASGSFNKGFGIPGINLPNNFFDDKKK